MKVLTILGWGILIGSLAFGQVEPSKSGKTLHLAPGESVVIALRSPSGGFINMTIQAPAVIEDSQVPVKPAVNDQQGYSGVIVDCRGLGLRPSISPKIRRADGSEVWGTVKIPAAEAISEGIALFIPANKPEWLTAPDVIKRMGQHPLTLKALGVTGAERHEAVLSDEDAKALLEANARSHFLDDYRVMFQY